MILAWQITMVTLFMVASVGAMVCYRLLHNAKEDREIVETMVEQDLRPLLALVDRNIRIARTRTFLSVYYLVVVPIFLLLPVSGGKLHVPLWIILFAAFLNYGMIAYSVWATFADRVERRELINGKA